MTWILVLYVYAGILAKGDSVSLVAVPGFTSKEECEQAGNAAKALVGGSAKEARHVCLAQRKDAR